MNLGQHIFNYLQQNGRVELPGFGIFTLEKKSAHLDESSSVLLPPVQEIKFQRNTLVFNSDLSKYVAEATDENLFVVQTKMKEEVLFWHDLLEKNNNLTIEEFESTKVDDSIMFGLIDDINNREINIIKGYNVLSNLKFNDDDGNLLYLSIKKITYFLMNTYINPINFISKLSYKIFT